MAEFDIATLNPGEPYKILSSLVVPRPIAWVVTQDIETGTVNVAPFSFFNLVGSDPPTIALGVSPVKRSGESKDTGRNLSEVGTGFVVHLVDEAHAEAMNRTASELPAHESEAQAADLALAETVKVSPVPRIATAPAALECRVAEIARVGNNRIVLGEVVYVHLSDALWDAEKKYVRTEDARLIGRMHGGGWYVRTSDRFSMDRPR
ncbi:MAG: flavin reductase family protein [Fibrella sp.]|nr:flavin reductase family protein [Armatimonadota bacterium]